MHQPNDTCTYNRPTDKNDTDFHQSSLYKIYHNAKHFDARPPNFTCGIICFHIIKEYLLFFANNNNQKKKQNKKSWRDLWLAMLWKFSHFRKCGNISIENMVAASFVACHHITKNRHFETMPLVVMNVKAHNNYVLQYCFVIKYYNIFSEYPISTT